MKWIKKLHLVFEIQVHQKIYIELHSNKKKKTNATIILSFLMIENEIGPTNGPLWHHENWENSNNSLIADCTLHRITSDNWSTTNGHVTPFDSQRFSLLLEEKPAFSPIRVLSCRVAGDPFLHFWDLLYSFSLSLLFSIFGDQRGKALHALLQAMCIFANE